MEERTILHIDMNAFFASVEQTVNPFVRHRPIGIGNPQYANTALVAVSYEARSKGVKKLARAMEAKAICPDLLVIPFDPLKYYAVNRHLVSILREYTPMVEVYSVDEAFLDLTPVLHLYKRSAAEIAQEIKQRILTEIGSQLYSSVGIAPNKLLAKIASDYQKPDGLTQITWANRLQYLDEMKVSDVWGIGFRSSAKLEKVGISTVKQLRALTQKDLKAMVGSYWTRLQAIANGENHEPVDPQRNTKPQKSMQHAHTLSEATSDPEVLLTIVRKMAERLARRLRRHDQAATVVHVGLKPAKQVQGYGWGSPTRFIDYTSLPTRSNNGKQIYEAAKSIFHSFQLDGTAIRLVVVGVARLDSLNQLVFTSMQDKEEGKLDLTLDEINDTYGQFTIRSADILKQKAKESELTVDRESMTFHPESK